MHYLATNWVAFVVLFCVLLALEFINFIVLMFSGLKGSGNGMIFGFVGHVLLGGGASIAAIPAAIAVVARLMNL